MVVSCLNDSKSQAPWSQRPWSLLFIRMLPYRRYPEWHTSSLRLGKTPPFDPSSTPGQTACKKAKESRSAKWKRPQEQKSVSQNRTSFCFNSLAASSFLKASTGFIYSFNDVHLINYPFSIFYHYFWKMSSPIWVKNAEENSIPLHYRYDISL